MALSDSLPRPDPNGFEPVLPDALGDVAEVGLPPNALWGKNTQLALRHFAIGDQFMPIELIEALLHIKGAAAVVNARLNQLDDIRAQAIDAAAHELLLQEGNRLANHFPLSPWQSGSGTQTHMNVNEVLAHLATLRLPPDMAVHPNDHVNRGQSSNDMVPSAMHLAVLLSLRTRLLPALDTLTDTLASLSATHVNTIKLGRTHLQDAVPMTFGQEVNAWRSQVLSGRAALEHALPALHLLAAGATAVGTGLNTHPAFARELCALLSERTGLPLLSAPDPFAALAGHEPLLALHGAVRVVAAALMKMANDVRLLASGPRGGWGELQLPANEPGSSIMPGKVNPTQCEALVMVCCQVFGNDVAVTMGAAGGQLQLNACKPLIIVNVLASLRLLADAVASFEKHALRGLQARPEHMRALAERSLMLATALAPHVGYDQATGIALKADQEGTTLREAALHSGVAAQDFDRWVDLQRMAAGD
jgi:fumarate hydratase, class II